MSDRAFYSSTAALLALMFFVLCAHIGKYIVETQADERWQKETLMRGYAEYKPDQNGAPKWQWKEPRP